MAGVGQVKVTLVVVGLELVYLAIRDTGESRLMGDLQIFDHNLIQGIRVHIGSQPFHDHSLSIHNENGEIAPNKSTCCGGLHCLQVLVQFDCSWAIHLQC